MQLGTEQGTPLGPASKKEWRPSALQRLWAKVASFALGAVPPIGWAFCTFLLTFVTWLGVPSPCAAALLLAEPKRGAAALFPLAGLLASLFFRMLWRIDLDLWQYVGCFALWALLLLRRPRTLPGIATLAGLSMVPRAISALFTGSPLVILLATTAVPLAMGLALAFSRGIALLRDTRPIQTLADKAFALLPVLAVLCGLGYLRVPGVNLGEWAAVLCTALCAYALGGVSGAIGGLLLGASLALCHHDSRVALHLALGGLAVGLVAGRKKRWLSALAFLAGHLVAFFMTPFASPALPHITVLLGLALFLLWGERTVTRLRASGFAETPTGHSMDGLFLQQHLLRWESAMRGMSEALPEIDLSAPELLTPSEQASRFRSRFERDMTATHLTAMSDAISEIRALTCGETLGDLQASYQINQALRDLRYPGRLCYARRVDGHLQAALETDSLKPLGKQPEKLLRYLRQQGGPSLSAVRTLRNRTELEETPLYSVEVGVAGLCAGQQSAWEEAPVCGDAIAARQFPGGRFVLLLSDGMGHGPAAHLVSNKTLELLLLCLEAGYTRRQAITAVNGMMLSATEAEGFATVDMVDLSLWTGDIQSEKLGACASWLVRGNYVKQVSGSSLPLGILAEVEPTSQSLRIHSGDILLLMSDGVADVLCDQEQMERAISDSLYIQPQRMADALLRYALLASGGIPKDDMTVVTLLMVDRNRSESIESDRLKV